MTGGTTPQTSASVENAGLGSNEHILLFRLLRRHHAHLHPPRRLLPPPGQVTAHALSAEDRGEFLFPPPKYRILSWVLKRVETMTHFCSVFSLHFFPPGNSFSGGGRHLHDWQLDAHRVRLDPQPPGLRRRSLNPAPCPTTTGQPLLNLPVPTFIFQFPQPVQHLENRVQHRRCTVLRHGHPLSFLSFFLLLEGDFLFPFDFLPSAASSRDVSDVPQQHKASIKNPGGAALVERAAEKRPGTS